MGSGYNGPKFKKCSDCGNTGLKEKMTMWKHWAVSISPNCVINNHHIILVTGGYTIPGALVCLQ